MRNKVWISLIIVILLASFVYAVPREINIIGKLTDSSGTVVQGNFNFSFRIYDSFTGGNKLYESTFNLTTDSLGVYDGILRNVTLNFSDQYYLGVAVNKDAEMIPRLNLTTSPYSFRSNISESLNPDNKYRIKVINITGNTTIGTDGSDTLTVTTGDFNLSSGNINMSGDLGLGSSITFGLGELIDNLVNGFLRITGSLNITNDLTVVGNVGIGTSTPNAKLVVIGGVNITGGLNVTGVVNFDNYANWDSDTSDDYNAENFTTDYAVGGYDAENFTVNYATNGFDNENFSTRYAVEGYSDSNTTNLRASIVNNITDANTSLLGHLNALDAALRVGQAANDTLIRTSIVNNITDANTSLLGHLDTQDIGIREGITGNITELYNGTIIRDTNSSWVLRSLDGASINLTALNVTGQGLFKSSIQSFVEDSSNASIVNVLTLEHGASNRGMPGLGASILFKGEDNFTISENISMIAGIMTNATNGSEAGVLTFSTRTSGGALTEQLRIDGSGNVGIGVIEPQNALEVAGTINASEIKVGTQSVIREDNESWVVDIGSLYNQQNFTANYALEGYDAENFTVNYAVNGFDNENFSARYTVEGYSDANTTGLRLSILNNITDANASIKSYLDSRDANLRTGMEGNITSLENSSIARTNNENTFEEKTTFNAPVTFRSNVTFTDTQNNLVNESLKLTDLDGATKILLNASIPDITIDGNSVITDTILPSLYNQQNFTANYALEGYDAENFTDNYAINGFDNENFSSRYAIEGYSDANTTGLRLSIVNNITDANTSLLGHLVTLDAALRAGQAANDTLVRLSIVNNITDANTSLLGHLNTLDAAIRAGQAANDTLVRLSIVNNITDANTSLLGHLNALDAAIREGITGNITELDNGTIIRSTNTSWIINISSIYTAENFTSDYATNGFDNENFSSRYAVEGFSLANNLTGANANLTTLNVSGQVLIPNGKVGIGTLTPAATLDVKGDTLLNLTTDSRTFQVVNGSGTSRFIVNESKGFVGIGTTSPSEKLSLNDGNFLQTPGNPTHEGKFDKNDHPDTELDGAYNVYVSGKYAYVTGNGDDGVEILDISDPANPTHVGKFNDSDHANAELDGAYGIFVSGKYAYVVSTTDNGMEIIDISNPANPTHVGAITDDGTTILGSPRDIYVSGKYAYVTSYSENGVEILDISDPANPTHVGAITDDGTTELSGAKGIYVSGKYAYVTGQGDDGVEILDISDPANPTHVGAITDDDTTELDGANGIYVSGKYAYIASTIDDGVEILDISNASNPTHVGKFNDTDHTDAELDGAERIYVSGKYAYVASNTDSGVEILDISDPANPTHVGAITDDDTTELNGPRGIFVSGKYAYVTGNTDDGLEILDISGIDAPAASIGTISTSTLTVTENADIGNNLYVGAGLNVGQGGILSDGDIATAGDLSAKGDFTINKTVFFANATSGRVGIGTSTPNAKLVIIGGVNITGGLNVTGVVNFDNYPNWDSDLSDDYNGANFTTDLTASGVRLSIVNNITDANTSLLGHLNTLDIAIREGITGNITELYNGTIIRNTNTSWATSSIVGANANFTVLNVSGQALFSNGNVGIGTQTPTKTLHVEGEINVTDTNIGMFFENGVFVIEG
jgi:hypothetical protein